MLFTTVSIKATALLSLLDLSKMRVDFSVSKRCIKIKQAYHLQLIIQFKIKLVKLSRSVLLLMADWCFAVQGVFDN